MKFLKVMFVTILVLSLTGCMGMGMGTAGADLSPLELPDPIPSKDASGFDKTLDGLCKYFEENYAVTGDRMEMAYETLGALGGYKYAFTLNGKTVQVEVYEFDLKNPNERSQAHLQDVRDHGSFTILSSEVPARLSGDEKFLMVYSDDSNDERNIAQAQRVYDLFEKF